MTYGSYHCDKCRADCTPYIRVGDEIRFWSRPLQTYVQGKVIKVEIDAFVDPGLKAGEAKTYTILHKGTPISVNHTYKDPVTLMSRPGLPVTYEQHIAYINEHHTTAPNILADWKMYRRIHDDLKKRVMGGAR